MAQTLTITNWNGALTRQNFGDINSGLANFDTSFGYNPFFNPGQLTWMKSPSTVAGGISGLVIAGCSRVEAGVVYTYVITNTGHFVKITGEGGGQADLHTLSTGSPTFTYGADMCFFGATDTIYIAHDKGVTSIKTDGSGETQIGTWDATHFTPIVTRRALHEFLGNLYVTNSDPSVTYANNIAEIIPAGTVSTYAKLSPSLPVGTYIRDIDISPDLTYLLLSASLIPSELLAPVNDGGNTGSSDSALYQWNGTDVGVTTGFSLPSFQTTALQSFSGKQMMFMYDTFGGALYDSGNKKLTLRNQKSPMPGATSTTGNFLTWMNPDFVWNHDTLAGSMVGSLYYYGQMDETTPKGLWRLFRQSSAIGGVIYSMPFNSFTTNRYISVDTNALLQVDSNGTHLFSFIDYSGSGGSTVNNLYIFYAAPPDDSPGTPWNGAIAGVYETQVQMLPMKATVKQIRVYTNPTTTNNGFNLDLIGPDSKKITNGSFSYSYTAGSDITQLKGAVDRINFNPGALNTYGVGVRITNTGSANMTINKVEIDWMPSGK